MAPAIRMCTILYNYVVIEELNQLLYMYIYELRQWTVYKNNITYMYMPDGN